MSERMRWGYRPLTGDSQAIASRAAVVALLYLAALLTGCGPKAPDYQSIWTTTTTTTTPTSTEPLVPLSQYLENLGVSGEQVAPDTLTDLTVSIPTPAGWEKVEKSDITPTTELIAKHGSYPTAMLMVFKLTGDFDAADVIKHGYADAQLSPNFKQLAASTANFHGFPSAVIQGDYDLKGTRLRGFNRIVIAAGSPPANQRYLVQLTITSLANQAVPEASDVEAIIAGFTIAAR
jgi:hypothetical protein